MNFRQDKILEILKAKKNISIQQLCQTLSYSHSTIRRDIISLQEMGLVKREKGNVLLLVSSSKEKHYKLRNKENIDEKQKLCQLATDFITDGMSIFLDSSSTVLQLCPMLEEYKNITVVTNGVEVVYHLIQNLEVEVFMAGGYTRVGTSSVIGEHAVEYIKQFNLDLCITSCYGLDEKGFYEASLQQSLVKKCMMENAEMTIMLCDDSKINKKYKFTLADYQDVDYLITNSKPREEICKKAEKSNCEIIYPESRE